MKRNWRSYVIMGLIICLTGSLTMLPASADMVIQPLPSLDDITDVNAPSPDDGDALIWDDASGYWIAGNVSVNVTDLQAQIDSLNATVISLQADVTNLQSDLSAVNGTVVSQGIDISNLQSDLSDLESIVSSLNSTVVGYGVDIANLQNDVSALQANFASLNSTVVSLNSTVTTLQGIVSDIQDDISDLQDDVSDLQDAVSDLEDRMDAAEDDIASNSGNITGLKNIAIVYVIDGGDVVITTGQKGHLDIPFTCAITGWTILADQSGSIVIDVWKDTYANFPPTVADTITGSEKPTLSAAQKNQDLSLGTWTTSVSAGDILAFNVDSCSTITRVTLTLTATRVI